MAQFETKSNSGGVPKTGQSEVYSNYDDGYYRKGMPLFGNRFVDNGNGTVTDRALRIMIPKSVLRMIPGLVGVTGDNLAVGYAGDWYNSAWYSAGYVVNDLIYNRRYICAVGHNSRPRPDDWYPQTYYMAGDQKRDSETGEYFQCNQDHTSRADDIPWWNANGYWYYAGQIIRTSLGIYTAQQDHMSMYNPNYWNGGGYWYNWGDAIYNPDDGHYYFCTTYHYSVYWPNYWWSYYWYNSGDRIYMWDGHYYVCNNSHYSSGDFWTDLSQGYWTDYGTSLFKFDKDMGYWYDCGTDLFGLEIYSNPSYWSQLAPSLFGLDRVENPSNWSQIPDTFQMENDRAEHPDYWRETPWVLANNFSNIAPATFDENINRCESLEFAGHNDWRMANINELSGLCYAFGYGWPPYLDQIFYDDLRAQIFSSTVDGETYWNNLTANLSQKMSQRFGLKYRWDQLPCIPVRDIK
jgi:hypothetical protein